jgi:hypothetical protein
MNAIFSILVVVSCYGACLAQDPIYPKDYDQNSLIFVSADYIPEPIMAQGGVQLFVGYAEETLIGVWYQTDNGKTALFQHLKTDETEEIFLNYAKAYWDATFMNDTLYFASEYPFRATQFHY